MSLANRGSLRPEDVQLLADGFQPIYVLKLAPSVETLCQRGLLLSVRCGCQRSQRSWFILETTEEGRASVAAWIDQHSEEAPPCDAPLAELSRYQRSPLSVLVDAALAL